MGRRFDFDHSAAAKAHPAPERRAWLGGALSQRDYGLPRTAAEAMLALQRHYGNHYVEQAVVQAKLVAGPPRDRYEREADRVARAVVRGTAGPGRLRIQSVGGAADGAGAGGRAGGLGPSGPQQGIRQARGRGQALPEDVRAPVEQALGTDLSHVRLHTDGTADRLSRSLQARAFTSGRDIFLRRGQADLTSPAGRELIAHELTHVAQQAGRSGTGEGVVQRKLWQLSPDEVYDDALKVTARRDTGNPHTFTDSKANRYEIGKDPSGNDTLVLVTGLTIPSAPSGWNIAGTQGYTAPPWAPPPVDEYWHSPGHTTSYSHSPGGSAYEPDAPSGRYAADKKGKPYSRREAAGYNNPGQSAHAMIPVFERSVVGPIPTGMTNPQKRTWLVDPARQYNVVSGPHGATTSITGYKSRPGPRGMISAVVLGHHPGHSASALFNAPGLSQPAGHTVPRATNQAFNNTAAAYHGLEDYRYSASTGHLEPRYESPRPDRDSHRSYWDSTSTGHTGGPWRGWKQVPSAQMTSYIEDKLTNVPVGQRDIDYYAARAELVELKRAYTQALARELLSMINTKEW
jgi:hypothetical protein